jgi:hypothetical protein
VGVRHQQQFLKFKRRTLHTIRVTVPQVFGKPLRVTQQPQDEIVRLHK